MSGLRYKDQSAGELRLHVVAGRLDARRFLPLATARLERDGLCVQAHVIGASHVIHVADAPAAPDSEPLTEVVACGPISAGVDTAFSGWLKDMAAAVELQLSPRLHYRFTVSSTDRRDGLPRFLALEQRIAEDSPSAASLGLDYSFPDALPERSSASSRERVSETFPPTGTAPRTLISVTLDAQKRRVTVETAHSYPNEGTIVFSDSVVSFGEPPTKRLPS